MTNKHGTYQVWHYLGWPQSRINQMLGGWPPTPFPDGFVQVANVQAKSLREAQERTTATGKLLEHLDGKGSYRPWPMKDGVKALAKMTRDTDQGDVIVDPDGQPHRVVATGFQEIVSREPSTASGQKGTRHMTERGESKQPRLPPRKDRGIER